MRKYIRIYLLILMASFTCMPAWALFDIATQTRRGSVGIQFEQSASGDQTRDEELTVEMVNDTGSAYSLFQTMYQPLTNEFGDVLPPGSLIVFSPSSSSQGVLRAQLETPVTAGRQLLYTSSSSGASDSLLFVYVVKIPENQPGGLYRSTLTLSMEPNNASTSAFAKTVHLDIRIDIKAPFTFKAASQRGTLRLDLGKFTKNRELAQDILSVSTTGSARGVYRISASLSEPFLSAAGKALEMPFSFSAQSAENGVLNPQGQVGVSSVVIYTSNEKGASDAFDIAFQLKLEDIPPAGIYNAMLALRLDSTSAFVPSQTLNVPVRVEIEPVFDLDVQAPPGGFTFGSFKTGDEQKSQQAKVSIQSNLGEPYQVSQIVSRRLSTATGEFVPENMFTYQVTSSDAGLSKAPVHTPVKQGESVIFLSDKSGLSNSFSVDYQLSVPKEAKSGQYTTDIRYSVTTI